MLERRQLGSTPTRVLPLAGRVQRGAGLSPKAAFAKWRDHKGPGSFHREMVLLTPPSGFRPSTPHFFASASAFSLARPFWKSLPSIVSMFMKRQTTLLTKLRFPDMLHDTSVWSPSPLAGHPSRCGVEPSHFTFRQVHKRIMVHSNFARRVSERRRAPVRRGSTETRTRNQEIKSLLLYH